MIDLFIVWSFGTGRCFIAFVEINFLNEMNKLHAIIYRLVQSSKDSLNNKYISSTYLKDIPACGLLTLSSKLKTLLTFIVSYPLSNC